MITQHVVDVGGSPTPVTDGEWLLATAPKGRRFKVTPKRGEPFVFVLDFTWFYDSVHAHGYEPDPDELIQRTVSPALGDLVEDT